MRGSSILALGVILVFIISTLSIWFYPASDDFGPSKDHWAGIGVFMDEFGVENIDSLDELPDFSANSILIAVPYLPYRTDELEEVKRFIQNGGILFLMDDYGYGNSVLTYLGINPRFSSYRLRDQGLFYKNSQMPRISDFSSEIGRADAEMVLLNNATILTDDKELAVIASSSKTSFLDINDDGERNDAGEGNDDDEQAAAEPKGPFPVVGNLQYGQGMVVLIADPSIIINSMIYRDDNRIFLASLISQKGDSEHVIFDNSHLSKTPLSVAKTRLMNIRQVLMEPFVILGIIGALFVVFSWNLRKKEINNGRY